MKVESSGDSDYNSDLIVKLQGDNNKKREESQLTVERGITPQKTSGRCCSVYLSLGAKAHKVCVSGAVRQAALWSSFMCRFCCSVLIVTHVDDWGQWHCRLSFQLMCGFYEFGCLSFSADVSVLFGKRRGMVTFISLTNVLANHTHSFWGWHH